MTRARRFNTCGAGTPVRSTVEAQLLATRATVARNMRSPQSMEVLEPNSTDSLVIALPFLSLCGHKSLCDIPPRRKSLEPVAITLTLPGPTRLF